MTKDGSGDHNVSGGTIGEELIERFKKVSQTDLVNLSEVSEGGVGAGTSGGA